MTLSMYQASVPVLVRALRALSDVLSKGEQHARESGADPKSLLDARLAPDMFPLPRQVQIATDMAKGGVARLAGIEPPTYADEESGFAELRARIDKTVAFLESVPADQIDGSEDRDIVLKIAGEEMPFKGQPYLLHFVLPNVFFHSATAYDLLRMKGVPLGKRDFLGGI
jgi:hypothetical protein